MKYRVVIARIAQDQFNGLDARWRTTIKKGMKDRLETQPRLESKSRIKRLRGLRQPEYRLRVGEFRIFYDVDERLHRVEVLGILPKNAAENWLEEYGVPS